MEKNTDWKEKATLIRKWSLVSTTQASSGHPTSCMSAADITTVLFDRYFTYDIKNPKNPNNDRFILSKGHASALLYILFAMSGGLKIEELMTLRKFGSRLEGHPTPEFPYAEVTTGSLGQGLSVGAGMAYALRAQITNIPKVYVLLGDGELAEGSVWEAANFASYYKLNNLIAIADINGLGQSQQTMFDHHIEEYVQRFSAFGFEVIAIDGHDFKEIDKALSKAFGNKTDKPFVIVAKTQKGKGVSFLEGKDGWHGKPLKKEELDKALLELGEVDDGLKFVLRKPAGPAAHSSQNAPAKPSFASDADAPFGSPSLASPAVHINYKKGEEIGTREVYGEILAKLADKNQFIYALDGDVKNSTYSQDFKKAYPDRFVECFIAEQNMVGVATGLSTQGKIPFVSTFAAFLTRAYDQIRMSAVSHANVKFVGSHAGVSIGEDGASQMGLEDIAMFGTLPNTVVLHPADAVAAAKLLPHMVLHIGISYLRTLRPKTKVIYNNDEEFVIGGSKVLHKSNSDLLTLVAAGITVYEAQKAYEILKQENIHVRVIDCYSIKPIDKATLLTSLKETKKKIIVTIEDHFAHGGLGDFVLSAVSTSLAQVEKLAVEDISRSGTKDELLDHAGISAKHIVEKVRSLLIAQHA